MFFDLYTTVFLITILILVITVVDIRNNRLMGRDTAGWAILACVMIALSTSGEYIDSLLNGSGPGWIFVHQAGRLVEFCCAPIICIALSFAYGSPVNGILAKRSVIVHILFELVCVIPGFIFYVDGINLFHRGPLYLLYIAYFMASLVYAFLTVVRKGKAYQTYVDEVLFWILVILSTGVIIQFLYSSIRIFYLCMAVVNMLLCIRNDKTMLQVDAVTGLLNRKCYDVDLSEHEGDFILYLFDVDLFKQVNDMYGHATGDICLQTVAAIILDAFGDYGQCYRIGGDEFASVVEMDVSQQKDAESRFIQLVADARRHDERMPKVSFGCSRHRAGHHIQSMIDEADETLYHNKMAGRAKV